MSMDALFDGSDAHLLPDRADCGRAAQAGSRQYIPSNGSEGECFIESWCANCARDKLSNGSVNIDTYTDGDLCEILNASFCGNAVQWRELENGETVCLAFLDVGETPQRRCALTVDIFSAQGADQL